MVETTNLSSLRLPEFYEAITLLYGELKQLTVEDEKVQNALSAFKTSLDTFDAALTLGKGSDLTPDLKELDARRDAAIVALTSQLRALTKSPDADMAGAASKLYILTERYGKMIYRQPYMQETGNLTNLLQDLESETYTPLVAATGIGKSVETLRNTNEAFQRAYIERLNEITGKDKGLAQKERQNLQQAFETLCQLVDAGILWTGQDLYRQMAVIINAHTKNARQKVAQRRAIKKGLEKKNAPDTPADPETGADTPPAETGQ